MPYKNKYMIYIYVDSTSTTVPGNFNLRVNDSDPENVKIYFPKDLVKALLKYNSHEAEQIFRSLFRFDIIESLNWKVSSTDLYTLINLAMKTIVEQLTKYIPEIECLLKQQVITWRAGKDLEKIVVDFREYYNQTKAALRLADIYESHSELDFRERIDDVKDDSLNIMNFAPLFDIVYKEQGMIIIKLDGIRSKDASRKDKFTIVASNPRIKLPFCNIVVNAEDLYLGLVETFEKYATEMWGYKRKETAYNND